MVEDRSLRARGLGLVPPIEARVVGNVAKGETHSRFSTDHFRNGVFPCVLTGATHNQKVAGVEYKSFRGATTHGSKRELPWRSKGDDGDDRVDFVTPDAVGVPSDRVVAITIKVCESGVDAWAVAGGQKIAHRPDHRMALINTTQRSVESGFFHQFAVHRATSAPPLELLMQGRKEFIGTLDPAGGEVDPCRVIEQNPVKLGPVLQRWLTLGEQAGLVVSKG
jgi:hypothetical protein